MLLEAVGSLGRRLVAQARSVLEPAGLEPLPHRLDLALGYLAKTFLPPHPKAGPRNLAAPESQTRGGIRPYKPGLDSATETVANSSWK